MEQSQDTTINWRIASPDALRWRIWNDEAVVYCERSGDTHLISAAAADILQSLQQAPASAADLAVHLALQERQTPDDALVDDVATILASLQELALIAPVAS